MVKEGKMMIVFGAAVLIIALATMIIALRPAPSGVPVSTTWQAGTGTTTLSTGSLACNDEDTVVGLMAVESIANASTGKEIPIKNAYGYVYKDATTQPWDTIYLSSTSYATSTTNKELACGVDTFNLIFGNDSGKGTYYYEKYSVFDGTGTDLDGTQLRAVTTAVQKKAVLDKIGNVTFTCYTTGNAPAQTVNYGTIASSAVTSVKCDLAEVAGAVFRKPAVFFNYNTSAIDYIKLAGDKPIADVPSRLSSYEDGRYFGIDQISNGEILTFNLDFMATSGATIGSRDCGAGPSGGGNASDSGCIGMIVADTGTYIVDGDVLHAFQDGAKTDVGSADSLVATLNVSNA